MLIALTRAVSPALARAQLTHLPRRPIDLRRAEAQHAAYEALLAGLGARVERVAALPSAPDAVFIEDTAVVLDELAVLTRPGAASRREEPGEVARALAAYRPVRPIEAPATLDGGDVLRVGRTLYVGRSTRSDAAGYAALQALAEPLGYALHPVPVGHCLHLKSAVTAIGERQLLLNPAWVDPACFAGLELAEVDPAEPYAANVLRVGGALVCDAASAGTIRRLQALGCTVYGLDLSELAKAEGGVTCCSLLFEAGATGPTQ